MSRAHMQGFLPEDYMETKAQRRTNVLWAMIFLVVAGGIGWAYYIAQTKIQRAEDINRQVNEQYSAAAKPIEQFQKLQEEQQRLNRQAELAHSLVEKVNRSNILAELTNSLPKNVYLTDFVLNAAKRAQADVAMTAYQRAQAAKKGVALPEPIVYDITIRLTGLAYTDTLVTEYQRNLEKSPLFKDVNFISTEATTYQDQKLRLFNFELVLNPAADTRSGAPLRSAQAN